MTSVLSRALPPPNNWQDFEGLCFDLYSRLWKTNDVEMHGRHGQPQAGVDVYGTDRIEQKLVGVQCKGKDEGYGNPLTKAELFAEVDKAKSFTPKLDVFILATTALNDIAIQQTAREITTQHVASGLFEVRVQGWLTLKQHITNFPDVLSKHFTDLAPYDLVTHIDSAALIVEREGAVTRALILQTTTELASIIQEKAEPGNPLELKINQAIKLLEDGSLRAALLAYERLWREEAEGASARNRFRLRANIAHVNLLLGNKDLAVRGFNEAFAEDPEWTGARAILATAKVLEGNLAEAYILASAVLLADQNSIQAACVIIDSASEDLSTTNLYQQIPQDLQSKIEILYALALRASRVEDYESALRYSRKAIESHPEDWRSLSSVADALFSPISRLDGLVFTRNVPPEFREAFDEALGLFRRAWDKLILRDDAIRGNYVAANLVSMLELSGLTNEAALVLDQAIRIAPNYQPLLRQYARNRASVNDWFAAKKAVEAMTPDSIEPADKIFLMHATLQTGDAAAAREQAKLLQNTLTDARLSEMAATVRLEASEKLGLLSEEIEDTLAMFPNSIILRSLAIELLPGNSPQASILINEVEKLIAFISDPRDRFHAADTLYRAKRYSEAADMYDGLHGTEHDHVALYRRLSALYFADRRTDARILFESLSENIRTLPHYSELGVAIYERAGMLIEAKDALERQLSMVESLKERLHWLSLVERLGANTVAIDWLSKVSPDQQGHPRDLMSLALAINRHLGGHAPLPLAYRALRNGFSDPEMHLGYTVGLFFSGKEGQELIEKPKTVSPDVAVTLTEKDGDAKLTRILETEPVPRIENDEIAPSDPLALRLLGLTIGDEITINDFVRGAVNYVIEDIQTKFSFVHFRSLTRFKTMFPESTAFGSFNVDGQNSHEKLKPIFDNAKSRHDFSKKLVETYQTGMAPLAFLATFSGRSVFDIWEFILHHPTAKFLSAIGIISEFAEADKVLNANQVAVIDPITLYGLVRLGISENVRTAFEDLCIVQTTLDMIRIYVAEQRSHLGRRGGSFGWDGHNFRMLEYTDELVNQMIAQAENVLKFAESLTLVPAESTRGIKSEAKTSLEDLHPAFLDTILAAQGEGRFLLCDDRPLRLLAGEIANVPAVWTQAAARFANERKLIDSNSYSEITGALVDCKYFFTMVGCRDFLYEISKASWNISERIGNYVEHLARPTNDLSSVNKVISELIFAAYKTAPSIKEYINLFSNIFGAMRKNKSRQSVMVTARSAFSLVESALHARSRSMFFKRRLTSTTSYTSVTGIAFSIDEVSNSVSNEIANAISQALANIRDD